MPQHDFDMIFEKEERHRSSSKFGSAYIDRQHTNIDDQEDVDGKKIILLSNLLVTVWAFALVLADYIISYAFAETPPSTT